MKLPALHFEPELEAAYERVARDRSLRLLRLAIIFTLPSIPIFLIWDYQQNPDKIGSTLVVRLAIMVWFGLSYWLTYTRLTRYWTAVNLFGFGSIVVGGSIIYAILDAFPNGSPTFILVMLWIPVGVTGLRAVVAVVAFAFVVPLLAMVVDGVDSHFVGNFVWWLSGGAAFALGAWMLTDQAYRRLFLAERSVSAERAKADALLLNILPAEIATELKESAASVAKRFDAATVMFADLVGFTAFSTTRQADLVVRLLNELFSRFDDLVVAGGVEKIKTLGDGYMAAGGVPVPRSDHAAAMVRLARQMHEETRSFAAQNGVDWQLRIGIHSGPVVAGVIGKHKFAYDLWGDTVNVASRIESQGEPGETLVSAATAALLSDSVPLGPPRSVTLRGHGTEAVQPLAG